MNPNIGSPSPVQNPFMQMLQKMQSQGAPQSPNQNQPGMMASAKQGANPVGATPAPQAGGQASGLAGVKQPGLPGMEPDATQLGANPGTTKGLLGASQQLHQVIAQLTDPQEIQQIRAILIVLQALIVKDQQNQNAKTGQNPSGQPPQGPQAGPPTPPGGNPIGGGMPPAPMPPGQPLPGNTPVGQSPPGSIPGQRF